MARLSVLVALLAVFVGCSHMPHPKYPLGDRDYNADPSRTYQVVKLETLVSNPSLDLAVEFWARLRDELKYDSVEALVAAIADAVERPRALVPPTERG